MTKQLTIVYKSLKDLIPYALNSRTHSDQQVAQIASSIKEFGFTQPILLDGKNGIIAGHGRYQAAFMLNMDKVPTIDLGHLSETQKRAYVIADNKLALNSGWDYEMLKTEMDELELQDFDLSLLGFSEDELKNVGIDENTDKSPEDVKEPIDENRNLLMIECEGERELEKLFEEMQQRGFQCKILS